MDRESNGWRIEIKWIEIEIPNGGGIFKTIVVSSVNSPWLTHIFSLLCHQLKCGSASRNSHRPAV